MTDVVEADIVSVLNHRGLKMQKQQKFCNVHRHGIYPIYRSLTSRTMIPNPNSNPKVPRK